MALENAVVGGIPHYRGGVLYRIMIGNGNRDHLPPNPFPSALVAAIKDSTRLTTPLSASVVEDSKACIE
jgi:hypothetical protein